MSNNKIEIKDLSFNFGKSKILSDIDISIEKGSFLSILGASGSGKSTLLRLISNILPKYNGEISIFGETPKTYIKTGKLSFMFQEPSLMPNLKVRDNIGFPLKLRGQQSDSDFIEELLEIVGLKEHQHKYPSELSGGMKTRVSLARAFVTKPDVLLLDEPFSALDISWRYELYNYLQKFTDKFNTTILLVTHDIQEATILGDQLIILGKSGIIIDQITPEVKDKRDYTFAGINDRIESNLTTILDIQSRIMIDNIRQNYTKDEAITVVKNLIQKDGNNESISEYELKEIQCVKKHIANSEMFNLLMQLWNNTDNWFIKNELMWRLLDKEDLSMEFHKEVHKFILKNWDKFVAYSQKEQYFRKDRIIENTKERLANADYPSSKDWLYLKYLQAMCAGHNELEVMADEFERSYKALNGQPKFLELYAMPKFDKINLESSINEK